MKFKFSRIAVVATLAAIGAVSVLAQPGGRLHGGSFNWEQRAEFVAGYLGLNDSQKEQARQIFGSTKNDAERLRGQMQAAREALETAVKTNQSDAEIDRLAASVGSITAQGVATMTKRFAKFYAILTPEQKQKVENMKQHIGGQTGPFGGRL